MRPAVGLSFFSLAIFSLVCAGVGLTPVLNAQAPAAPVPAAAAPSADASALADELGALPPTMNEVNLAVSGVEVRKWKAPGDVKDTANSDIQSIERDLSGTLPGLVSQAQAAPGTIAPAFAVYRNLDALYDVLLRVTETATLAGSQQEAARLEGARADLQTRRSQLGNALLTSATVQDTNVVQLRASLDAAKRGGGGAAGGAPTKIVVNDGPDTSSTKTVHKKKPAAKPATPAPAPAAPSQ